MIKFQVYRLPCGTTTTMNNRSTVLEHGADAWQYICEVEVQEPLEPHNEYKIRKIGEAKTALLARLNDELEILNDEKERLIMDSLARLNDELEILNDEKERLFMASLAKEES